MPLALKVQLCLSHGFIQVLSQKVTPGSHLWFCRYLGAQACSALRSLSRGVSFREQAKSKTRNLVGAGICCRQALGPCS